MQKNSHQYSSSYITTNMSAIRYFYTRTSNGKMNIKTNKQLGIKPRSSDQRIKGNKSMKNEDYEELIDRAINEGKEEYAYLLILAHDFGLRLHESYSLRKSQIRKAIKEESLPVKGKGGLIRHIPLQQKDINLLKDIKNATRTGSDRIFVTPDQKTHKEMKKFQNFLRESKREGKKINYRALRHSYAQNLYKDLLISGQTDKEAFKVVNKRLGHGPQRKDITRIYLQK